MLTTRPVCLQPSPASHFLCHFLQNDFRNVKWRFECSDEAKHYRAVYLCVFVCLLVSVWALGVNSLCQSLSANPSIASSLVHLDLSGNMLRGDDMQVNNPPTQAGSLNISVKKKTNINTLVIPSMLENAQWLVWPACKKCICSFSGQVYSSNTRHKNKVLERS